MRFQKFEASLKVGTDETGQPRQRIPQPDLPPEVIAAIRRADDSLRTPGKFEAKIAADLLRTCMDEAHRFIVQEMEMKTSAKCEGNKDADRRRFMRENQFITQPEESFFTAIYSLISQEASHKLLADRETVLVLRLTVVNYIQLLFRRFADWKPRQVIPNATATVGQ